MDNKERTAIRKANMGRVLSNGKCRNFCCSCGMPLEVDPCRAMKMNLRCDDCVSPSTGNKMSTAFSPEKAKYKPV